MQAFAELLDALSFQPARNAKLRLIETYLRQTPDPDRGWALAAVFFLESCCATEGATARRRVRPADETQRPFALIYCVLGMIALPSVTQT